MPRSTTSSYCGRFAPSPTGPLHLGSLIAALASYLDARHHCGQWLVRMEDLDPPREEPGAAQHILNSLQQHGLQWDANVLWQSQRDPAYRQALAELGRTGWLFKCDCTRARLGAGGACNGHCLARQQSIVAPYSVRVAVSGDTSLEFFDRIQPLQPEMTALSLPDFVLRRKDELIAYQLAVVVDDHFQGVTHIVRGSDLLDCTPRQIYLQRLLGYTSPSYAHLPVITSADGQKFSKQNYAPALEPAQAPANLRQALQFLQQLAPPITLTCTHSILKFATQHWSITAVPKEIAIPAASLAAQH